MLSSLVIFKGNNALLAFNFPGNSFFINKSSNCYKILMANHQHFYQIISVCSVIETMLWNQSDANSRLSKLIKSLIPDNFVEID